MRAPSADSSHTAPAPVTAGAWTAGAFGLTITGAFAAPGLAGRGSVEADAPRVRIWTADDRPEWPGAGPTEWAGPETERVIRWRLEGTGPVLSIDRHPTLGYRLFALDQGIHHVAPDGRAILCDPQDAPEWAWQRYLVGQALPLAAVLCGAEVLHASVVGIDGRAVAFVASSGVGKTSLALNLVLRGARFVADDVAAVRVSHGRPMVAPGPPLTNLRHEEAARMGSRRAALGEVIAADEETLRLALSGPPTPPLPLHAIYFLHRDGADAAPAFRELTERPWPQLIASSFTSFHATPERLRNQLRVMGAVSEQARMFDLSIPAGVGAAELSAHVEAHVDDAVA